VGAGVGFRITLAPPDLAACDLGKEAALLLFGAEFQQRRAEHRDAEAEQRVARFDTRQFLLQYPALPGRKAAPAIFDRPVGNGPPTRCHRLHPASLRIILEFGVAAAPAVILFAVGGAAHFKWAMG